MSDYIPINYDEDYTVFCDLDNDYDVSLINYNLFNENKEWLGDRVVNGETESFSGTKKHTFKINLANSKYIRIVFRNYISALDDLSIDSVKNSKIQLEEGTTASPYVPYNCIQIKKCNKNWFNPTEFEAGLVTDKIRNDSGEEVRDTVSTYSTYMIPYKANEPIHIYGYFQRIYFLDKNKNWIERTGASNELKNFTITRNVDGYMQFQIQNQVWASNKGQEQIENGSTHTSYVPHAEKTYNFPLSEGQKLYEDSTLQADGIHNKRKQIVLDGTEASWRIISTNSTRTAFEVLVNDIIPYTDGSVNPSLISNRFISASYNDTWKHGNISRWENRKSIILIVNPDTDLATFTSWLASLYANGTPVIVEYELAEEEIIPYTEEQQAVYNEIISDGTYLPVTHYSTNALLNPDIDMTYFRDLPTIINNLEN